MFFFRVYVVVFERILIFFEESFLKCFWVLRNWYFIVLGLLKIAVVIVLYIFILKLIVDFFIFWRILLFGMFELLFIFVMLILFNFV